MSPTPTPPSAAREAGRALDKVIAELMEPFASLPTMTAHEARLRVWGGQPASWHWTTSDEISSPLGWWSAIIGTDHGHDPASDHLPVRWRVSHDREPSTDIAAAWLVVENRRAQGWCLSLHEEAGKSLQWVATFVRDAYGDDYEDTGEDLALTAPLAICRAALATLSPEVPRA